MGGASSLLHGDGWAELATRKSPAALWQGTCADARLFGVAAEGCYFTAIFFVAVSITLLLWYTVAVTS